MKTTQSSLMRAVVIHAQLKNLQQVLDQMHTHGKETQSLIDLREMLAKTLTESDNIFHELAKDQEHSKKY